MSNIKRIFTSLVRCKDSEKIEVIPVKSTEPVDIELFIPISKVLSRIYVGKPVFRGDIICTNVLNLNINIVATKTMNRI